MLGHLFSQPAVTQSLMFGFLGCYYCISHVSVINFKLCLMVAITELFPFRPFSDRAYFKVTAASNSWNRKLDFLEGSYPIVYVWLLSVLTIQTRLLCMLFVTLGFHSREVIDALPLLTRTLRLKVGFSEL